MKRTPIFLAAIGISILAMCSFDRIPEAGEDGSIAIGAQVWMAKNLDVTAFRNGDPIPHAQTEDAWKEAGKNGTPAWCYYGQNEAHREKYGKLYNHHAVMDPRGLAPEGWHIPSDEEWTELTDYLGKKAGHKMKATKAQIKDGAGSNKSGFSGLLGGHCFANGMSTNRRVSGTWHSTTAAEEPGTFYTRQLKAMSDEVGRGTALHAFGLSVRCVKDQAKAMD